jgi:N-acetylmuramoyl-L-alanine amidase
MPKKMLNLFIFLFVFGIISFYAFNGYCKTRVVIDPGHGGRDSGAIRDTVKESKIVLEISQILAQKINTHSNFEALLVRESDENIPLIERVEKIKKMRPDMVISIHANSSDDEMVAGGEIYLRSSLPPDEQSLFLAHRENQSVQEGKAQGRLSSREDVKNILTDLGRQKALKDAFRLAVGMRKNWPKSFKQNNKMIKQAPFFVISQLDVPALLIETGYVTHPTERKKLASQHHQNEIANGIYQAIIQHPYSF